MGPEKRVRIAAVRDTRSVSSVSRWHERCARVHVRGPVGLPVLANGERQGDSYWPVLSGPMKFIFITDAAQSILCLVGAVVILG